MCLSESGWAGGWSTEERRLSLERRQVYQDFTRVVSLKDLSNVNYEEEVKLLFFKAKLSYHGT